MKLTRYLLALAAVLHLTAGMARADALDSLREFVHVVKSGRAAFTQTVTAADGLKKKVSSGRFEFMRPNRFRFEYSKPYEQLIVGDGQKVWVYDADLNQASSRPLDKALGSTPAALLTGGSLDKDFELAVAPSGQGLDWVLAVPRVKDGAFQSMRVGFRGKQLVAVEVLDAFGQRSYLQFDALSTNVSLPPERFRFDPPKDAELLVQ